MMVVSNKFQLFFYIIEKDLNHDELHLHRYILSDIQIN